MLRAISDKLLSLLYPQPCKNCNDIAEHHTGGAACSQCWSKTRVFTGGEMLCQKCGTFLSENGNVGEAFCHHCDRHHYDLARSAGVYEHGLASSVIELKTTPDISREVRDVFLAAFQRCGIDDATRIIPVPLSRRRQVERGFNQAAVLASLLSKHAGIAFDENSLIRTVHTPIHRAAMDRKARDLTVKNAFKVARPNLIKNENILLIDDVLTSGATVSYCAKILKKNGAGKVYVFTLARAV